MNPTWIRPFAAVWREKFDAEPNWGLMGKALKPIADRPDGPTRLRRYLDATGPQYVNLFKFAATFGAWVDPQMERPGESVDDYMKRLAGSR